MCCIACCISCVRIDWAFSIEVAFTSISSDVPNVYLSPSVPFIKYPSSLLSGWIFILIETSERFGYIFSNSEFSPYISPIYVYLSCVLSSLYLSDDFSSDAINSGVNLSSGISYLHLPSAPRSHPVARRIRFFCSCSFNDCHSFKCSCALM